jgi:hypothetical protein
VAAGVKPGQTTFFGNTLPVVDLPAHATQRPRECIVIVGECGVCCLHMLRESVTVRVKIIVLRAYMSFTSSQCGVLFVCYCLLVYEYSLSLLYKSSHRTSSHVFSSVPRDVRTQRVRPR